MQDALLLRSAAFAQWCILDSPATIPPLTRQPQWPADTPHNLVLPKADAQQQFMALILAIMISLIGSIPNPGTA